MTFFQHFPRFAPLPLQNFGEILNLIIPPMCILWKLDSAMFGVSNLFFEIYRYIFEFYLSRPPPLVKEGLMFCRVLLMSGQKEQQ